jgi:hypothetical protein
MLVVVSRFVELVLNVPGTGIPGVKPIRVYPDEFAPGPVGPL